MWGRAKTIVGLLWSQQGTFRARAVALSWKLNRAGFASLRILGEPKLRSGDAEAM